VRTPDYYTDDPVLVISREAMFCPYCGNLIKKQLSHLLTHESDAVFMICSACEVHLEIVKRGGADKEWQNKPSDQPENRE